MIPFRQGYGGISLHLRSALVAAQGIDLVNLLDQRGPPFAGRLPPRRQEFGSTLLRLRHCHRGLRLGSLPAILVRIPSVIADWVVSLPRDVLGHFGQEIQWIENLEVALGTGHHIIAGGLGKSPEIPMHRDLVDHSALIGHLNHQFETFLPW